MEKGTARLLGGDREGFQLQSRRTHPSLSSTTPLDLSTQISSSITISANSDRTSKGETGYKGLDLLPLEISIEDVNPRALEPVALGAEMSGRRRREEGERVGLAPSHQRSSKSPRHLSLSHASTGGSTRRRNEMAHRTWYDPHICRNAPLISILLY